MAEHEHGAHGSPGEGALSGMSIVVTGAGTGIGRSIAECLVEAGAGITAVGRRKAPLEDLAAQAGEAVQAVAADIATPGSPRQIVDTAVTRFGRLDAVVNNAGLARFGRLDEIDPEELDAVLRVNVRAPADLIRCALPQLRAHRGSVVNISSVAGALAMPERSFYGASKAALNSLTRSLARELAPEVRVNAILPGPVDTPMWHETGLTETDRRQLAENLTAATPMGRFGRGREIGRWVCCLLDPAMSGWVTGALIPVDGGRTS
ncbi:SDR family NAD(P)-dependent oxidoreductase [Streptomyces sp. NPDC057654]|uniref:SDR family NAD(P)-dependent oxidoreductase n=1 Tax=Streptomyces sp. NPDC057654 TaxID=3346196 RepID=UPI00369F6C8C